MQSNYQSKPNTPNVQNVQKAAVSQRVAEVVNQTNSKLWQNTLDVLSQGNNKLRKNASNVIAQRSTPPRTAPPSNKPPKNAPKPVVQAKPTAPRPTPTNKTLSLKFHAEPLISRVPCVAQLAIITISFLLPLLVDKNYRVALCVKIIHVKIPRNFQINSWN